MNRSCSTCQHSIGNNSGGLGCKKYGFELIRRASNSIDENRRTDTRMTARADACGAYARDIGIEEPCPMCHSRLGTDTDASWDGNARCLNCGCY